MTLFELSATEAISKIRDGEITSEELIRACLNRIEDVDNDIQAWTHLNPDYALEQARILDAQRQKGGPVGPLHGIPIGRFGRPNDVHGEALFLASDASSWITGALIPMDGGDLAMTAGVIQRILP